MRLIIVRHGETKENIEGIVQGHSHGTLTARGRAQIRELSLELKAQKIDAIFSSDLGRAAATAKGIGKYHKASIYYAKELRERNPGIYHGKSRRKFIEDEKASGYSKVEYRPQGGETYGDMIKRLRKFMLRIGKKYHDKTVLVVTHGLIVKCLLAICMKVPIAKAAGLSPRNAGILIIDIGKTGARKTRDDMFTSAKERL